MSITNFLSNPTVIWLIIGCILCFTEIFVPTAFTSFVMGLSAIIVAIISLAVTQLSWQIALWMVFSLAFVLLSGRLLPKSKSSSQTGDDLTGEMLTEILPGQSGRVMYEGASWRAESDYEERPIRAGEKVYVVRKQGNTLIVLPQKLLE